jgi:hypothetical protein
MKPREAILAALALSTAFAAESENILYDVRFEPEQAALFAASDNVLFGVTSTETATAATVAGTREMWIAAYGADNQAVAADFLLLAKLRAGDTGPTPEAVTEDTTYDNGTVVTNQTGINNGSKTWEIEGSADDPAITMLIDHSRVYGTSALKGKSLAYIAFNADRSSFSGSIKVTTASAPRDGSHRWVFTIAFESVELRRPSQNPAAGATTDPFATSITPTSGAVGSTVTINGGNLTAVTTVRLGATAITTFSTQTADTLAFAVPTGTPLGEKVVDLVHANGEEFAGKFTVV